MNTTIHDAMRKVDKKVLLGKSEKIVFSLINRRETFSCIPTIATYK